MKTLEILIGEMPHIVGLGDHPVGHFIAYQYGRNIRATYIKGGRFSATLRNIIIELVEVELDTDELKPLTDYFDPSVDPANGAAFLVGSKVIQEYENKASGPAYGGFYALQAEGSSGDILYRNALQAHIKRIWGVDCINPLTGVIFQPVVTEVIEE